MQRNCLFTIWIALFSLCSLNCGKDVSNSTVHLIGPELVHMAQTDTCVSNTEHTVWVGHGLKRRLAELAKQGNSFEYSISKGDAPYPIGDNSADYLIAIKSPSGEQIMVRVKYNLEADRFDILGFYSLN